jgi:hypothetical protein
MVLCVKKAHTKSLNNQLLDIVLLVQPAKEETKSGATLTLRVA